MDYYKKTCQHCFGSGIWSAPGGDPPGSCPFCNGSGYFSEGRTMPPENVFESYLILEELDATEHNALTDTQKDGVLHLLACGQVDLNTGKVGRVRLWNWFGAESTTVANLTELIT